MPVMHAVSLDLQSFVQSRRSDALNRSISGR
jgi:hypothetical protein